MRVWICALAVALSLGCSDGGGTRTDGGAGNGQAGGAGGQAGGAAGAAGQAGGAGGRAGSAAGAAGQAGGAGGQAGGAAGAAGQAGGSGSGGGGGGRGGSAGAGGRGGGAGGAGGQAGNTSAGGRGGASDGGTDGCATLPGSTFLSVDLLECGRGVDGGVRCNWRVMFFTSSFAWQHSDVSETGNYSCTGNAITTRSQRNVTGSYDPFTMRLTWDGVVYARQ
jgi:hypothetical protein